MQSGSATMTKKFWAVLVSIAFSFVLLAPAYAQDHYRDPDKRDLHGISAKRHRLIFSTIAGAALGTGAGALLAGSGGLGKGFLIGSGLGSAWYMHRHPNAGENWHDLDLIASHTALVGGLGWTLCDCHTGLGVGSLVGGGATAWWLSNNDGRHRTTAQNSPGSNP